MVKLPKLKQSYTFSQWLLRQLWRIVDHDHFFYWLFHIGPVRRRFRPITRHHYLGRLYGRKFWQD